MKWDQWQREHQRQIQELVREIDAATDEKERGHLLQCLYGVESETYEDALADYRFEQAKARRKGEL
jgi:hypothetical protein